MRVFMSSAMDAPPVKSGPGIPVGSAALSSGLPSPRKTVTHSTHPAHACCRRCCCYLARHLIANTMRLMHAVISPAARHRPRTKNKKAKESKYELGSTQGGVND